MQPMTYSYAIEVQASPTFIYGGKPYAARVCIQNLSGADLYIGDNTVSVTTGFLLTTGSTFVLEQHTPSPVYGVAAAPQSSPVDTRVFVEGK